MRAYTYPPIGGSSIMAWRGGYCLFFDWAFGDASWRINQTSLHAIFYPLLTAPLLETDEEMTFLNMIYYRIFIHDVLPLFSFFVALLACHYTRKTYLQSYKIRNLLNDTNYHWNKNELEQLFGRLSISSIESFFQHPDTISDILWFGLGSVDLNTFQYIGKERKEIENFINSLYKFCLLNYKQQSAGHWKYSAFNDNEEYDADKEVMKINELESRARALIPSFKKIKKTLLSYHINIRDIDARANEFYSIKKNVE